MKKFKDHVKHEGDGTLSLRITTKCGKKASRKTVWRWRQGDSVITDGKDIYMKIGEFDDVDKV